MLRTTLAAALIGARLYAQVPAVPAAPVAAVPAAPAAAAPAGNIWSKICLTPEQKAKCKAHICASPVAQLMGGFLSPYRAMSGGLMQPFCPGPLDADPSDLTKPADGAEGAAAKIKQNEAEAKARRAAVRYLGTVDCRRYPEAEAALINALRGDANECVRLEAARAFRNGCCCSKKVIEALTAAVSGEKTADAAETSPRVRCVAAEALERCLAMHCDIDVPKPPEKAVTDPKPEDPPEAGRPAPPPAALPDELPPPGKEAVKARVALARYRPALTPEPPALEPVVAPPMRAAPPSGQRNLWSLLTHAAR